MLVPTRINPFINVSHDVVFGPPCEWNGQRKIHKVVFSSTYQMGTGVRARHFDGRAKTLAPKDDARHKILLELLFSVKGLKRIWPPRMDRKRTANIHTPVRKTALDREICRHRRRAVVAQNSEQESSPPRTTKCTELRAQVGS